MPDRRDTGLSQRIVDPRRPVPLEDFSRSVRSDRGVRQAIQRVVVTRRCSVCDAVTCEGRRLRRQVCEGVRVTNSGDTSLSQRVVDPGRAIPLEDFSRAVSRDRGVRQAVQGMVVRAGRSVCDAITGQRGRLRRQVCKGMRMPHCGNTSFR